MSTDRQSADSPADQIARCRAYATTRGWAVVESLVITEAAISGASRHNRPGLLGLFDRIDEWDVILAWDFSRLTRDTEDLGWIKNRCREAGRNAIDVLSGRDVFDAASQVMGVLNAFEREKIAEHTRRGMFGRAERGLATGGAAYGYRIAADKKVVIDPTAAEVVRRIFQLAANGEGVRAIAHRLNAEGAPPPRPRANRGRPPSWSPGALQAILANPLYLGEVTYGKTRYAKVHSTGRRRSKALPASEWLTRDVQALAIVDRDLWARVHERKARWRPGASHRGSGPRTLLAGFLSCGQCGGSFGAVHRPQVLECSWRHDRGEGVCASPLKVATAEAEVRVLNAIRDQILTPKNVAYCAERTLEEIAKERRAADPKLLRRELDAFMVERNALIDAHIKGLTEPAESEPRLRAQLERKRELERRLAASEAETTPFDPEALRPVIERTIRDLHAALVGDLPERRDALRALLGPERLRVYPDREKGFRLEGALRIRLDAPSSRSREGASYGSGGPLHPRRAGPRVRAPYLGCMKNAVDFSGRTWVGMRSFSGTTCRSLRPRVATGPATATRYTATARKAGGSWRCESGLT
jgi:DNA invertase Pin-like site-specific DNA recombinase